MIGRMPGIEGDVLVEWLKGGKSPASVSKNGLLRLEQNTGFYSNSEDYETSLDTWCHLTLDALRNCDLLFRLEVQEESDILCEGYLDEIHIWSATRLHQWLPLLEGKKVLVISPFEDSIHLQWERRECLFLTGHIPFNFPMFELQTLKAYNTIKGNTPFPHKNWVETFNALCAQIEKLDFDVAVLGCGGYGMPLSHFIKKLGKSSFYIGSYAQIMFGIKGQRWNLDGNTRSYWNDAWKWPEPHEVPKTYKNVEGGCYWK